MNSTIRDFVKIGDDVLVGMRGLVTRNIKSGSVVYENEYSFAPDDRKARAIKRIYSNISSWVLNEQMEKFGLIVKPQQKLIGGNRMPWFQRHTELVTVFLRFLVLVTKIISHWSVTL